MAAVLDLKGKHVGDLKLSDAIFAKAENKNSAGTMHAALVRQLGNARAGSANSKTRSEVRGGGAKPWRQKGTGRARAGSRRSPLWAGGGVTFGPKPRDYSSAMPTKMRHSAIKSALAAQAENLVVVNDFSALKEIKTKEVAKVLQTLKLSEKRVLVVLEPKNPDAERFGISARNLNHVTVVLATNLGVKELLNCQAILTSQGAIEVITNWLVPAKQEKTKVEKKVSKVKPETETKSKAKPEKKVEEAKVIQKHEDKSSDKHSTLKSIATTSAPKVQKAHEAPTAKKLEAEEKTAKPKKAASESEGKGKGKGK